MMNSGGTVFNLPEFKPYLDVYNTRVHRFTRLRRYYDGSIYADSQFKLAHKLYAQTKALFQFLARAVDIDIALIPGVMGPWELQESTAADIIGAQQRLYDWSDWATAGDDWLEDGATLGEAMLKIVPTEGAVQMQRLKPELCLLTKHMDPGTQQQIDLALIVDRSSKDASGEYYEYAEVITPMQIRTYKDGEPHPFAMDPESGLMVDRYPNPLGFVPVLRTKNDTECRPTFSKLMPQLNSVNEMASYLSDIIGRHAEPQWAAFGVEPSDMTKGGGNVWFMPSPDAKMQAILAEIDIEGTLKFIEAIKDESKANLPELAFDDLRAKDQIATETLEVQLVELDAKIWKMRRRYDAGLVRAHQMAAMAATIYGAGELAPLLKPHSLSYRRPVRPVSRLEQIREEEAELALEMQKTLVRGEAMTATAQA